MKKYACIPLLIASCIFVAHAQQAGVQTMPLEDLSSFKAQAGNWRIVGDVFMNRSIDVHQQPEQGNFADTKKSRKRGTKTAVTKKPQAVTFTPGKGVLLNINDETKKDNLITNFEHGDIELELEVMLPMGSNSGIYLQGRYEVQLLDSWGVKKPKYSDMGGIYRNWENTPDKIYMGKAPLTNPSKAPGLWQVLKISFSAPKFDPSGKKISNARFNFVELNGIKIHDNVEVPLPTGGPVENNEKSLGPIMVQGDHGPVAFRNVRYRIMKEIEITLSNISYKTYYGNFKSVSDYQNQKPDASGSLPELTCEILEKENDYGSTYTGNVNIPEDGAYEFILSHSGGATFSINSQELVNIQRPDASGRNKKNIFLKAGSYPFEIQNFKSASWMPPRLGLTVQSPASYPKALHAFNSLPPDDNPASPILINPTGQPKLLRAFIDFKGDRSRRLTHTIGIGEPGGINYVYDLKAANLVCVWRGNFVDATPMWNDRGDGSFRPMGATQYLFIGQPLAFLSEANDEFPSVSSETDFRGKGYVIDETTARPVFKYLYRGLEVEDKIYPENENKIITHELSIKNRGTQQGLYYKLAEGKSITSLEDGSFAIDDKQYYVTVDPDPLSKPIIREVNGKKELVVAVNGSSVKYSIIW